MLIFYTNNHYKIWASYKYLVVNDRFWIRLLQYNVLAWILLFQSHVVAAHIEPGTRPEATVDRLKESYCPLERLPVAETIYRYIWSLPVVIVYQYWFNTLYYVEITAITLCYMFTWFSMKLLTASLSISKHSQGHTHACRKGDDITATTCGLHFHHIMS